jgi:cytochrome c peroxidase
MPLVNLRYYRQARFFWDERAGSPIETGQDIKRVVATLARDTMYPVLFARAFGDTQITDQKIGKALAQFVRAIVSYASRYDEGRARVRTARDDFDNFTLQENRGKALFMRNCSTCHVEMTAPYGHDGRFATLDALIDHYSDNLIFDPNLAYMIPVDPLKFTASEKAAPVAFLKTLTDGKFLTDPRFANPFVDRKDIVKTVKGTVKTAGAMLRVVRPAPHKRPWSSGRLFPNCLQHLERNLVKR